MVSTLILAIAPCFRIVVIKITPRAWMINGSTLTISQSFVLKWNFATSKGCFLRPITVFSMGGNWLLNIGFRAPTPCSFSIFLSRMDAKSAPFFAISINSCAPLVSKKWNIIVQIKLCQMHLFTYQCCYQCKPWRNEITYFMRNIIGTCECEQIIEFFQTAVCLQFWYGFQLFVFS